MKSKITTKSNWKEIGKFVLVIVLALITGAGVDLAIRPTTTEEKVEIEATTTLELSDEQMPATIVDEDGEEIEVAVPTVEEVDGGKIPTELEQMPDAERNAQGFAIDITTPWTVVKDLNNKCIIMGNPFGSQCVNTTNVIAENQVGYWFSTCGTGAARGMWDCREENARGGYELITDPTELRPGDLFVTWGGDWGHTGMVIGYYKNGYVPVFSTNQGGSSCYEGGSAANTINLSMATFSGAFRWHGWDWIFEEQEEPEEEPEVIPITGCEDWKVKEGQTMSLVMLICEGTVVYGEAMDNYAKSYISQEYMPDKSVYWGWHHGPGIGMWAGDYLIHDISGTHVDPE